MFPSRLQRLRRALRWIEPLAGLALFAVALVALRNAMRGHSLSEIGRTLDLLSAQRVVLGVALVVASYAILTLYDVLGVRYAGRRLPYSTVAPASFVSYAISHNLGMAALTSAPLRFRFYSAAGLGPIEIARIVVFVGTTFWLGVVALGGVAFVAEPLAIPASWPGPLTDTRPLGVGLVVLTLAYLLVLALRRAPLRVGSFELKLPSPRLGLLQIAIASADVAAAAGVLYVLLPASAEISFAKFLAVYVMAIFAGIVSQVPGGLGVFEAVVVTMLPVDLPAVTLLATLLAYRALYYFLPLLAAGVVLTAHEVWRHRVRLAPWWSGARAWSAALTPHAASAVVFLAGAVLLLSGSIPAVPHRLHTLGDVVPLPLIELSHLLGSVAGVGLLFVARGLQRRLDSAYVITLLLLGTGVVASLAKGLDYEEAGILGVVILIVLPNRSAFYRKSALLAERYSIGWFAAVAVVLGAATWLSLLAFSHAEYSSELWWQFALHGEAPRVLRATVAVAVAAVAIAVARLVGPADREPEPADAATLARAAVVVATSSTTSANLALLGDKTFLFSDDDRAFIMYGVEGRSWIAMGDPVGSPESPRELVWKFRGLVDRYDGWPVFYQVRPENIPLYLDLGLTMLKLGEEAIVPLDSFSLEGGARKALRHARRNAEKAGCRFEVTPVDEAAALLPALQPVSDEWLAAKSTREKGFSLGRFDDAYVRRFPQAVVRRDGAVVAFATVWACANREELSIDLMRYSAAAPPGVMDYLFVELMLWGRSEGYRRFNLGMAPMSGLDRHALAPLWNRVGAFLFHHAEDFYNFQGLRAYKDKFDPSWEPRYLASRAGFALPRILTNVSTLIAGSLRGVLGA